MLKKEISKKKKIIILIIAICCLLSFVILKLTPNKMIYSVEKQDDNYFVSVSDNQGKIIYEDLYYVEPVISKVGENTIMVTVGRGDFWISTFINGKTGDVSEGFENISGCSEKLVVYGTFEEGKIKIIIRDIYNKEQVYKEIIEEFPNIAVGSYVIKDVKVINNHLVYLNYYLSNDWKEEEKIILIR